MPHPLSKSAAMMKAESSIEHGGEIASGDESSEEGREREV